MSTTGAAGDRLGGRRAVPLGHELHELSARQPTLGEERSVDHRRNVKLEVDRGRIKLVPRLLRPGLCRSLLGLETSGDAESNDQSDPSALPVREDIP